MLRVLLLTHEDFYVNQPIRLNMLHGHFCNAADHSDVVIVRLANGTHLVLKDVANGIPGMTMSQDELLRFIAARLETEDDKS